MKLTGYANKIEAMVDALNDKVAQLEDKRDAIEDKAIENGRDMTYKEEEKYYKYDEQIDELNDIIMELDALRDRIDCFGEED